MLVLTRKPGEKINIGGDVTITVCAVEGNKVRIAIDAPRQVRILRGELIGFGKPAPAPDAADADLAAKPREWLNPAPDYVVSR
jgi:carbon storage regulator